MSKLITLAVLASASLPAMAIPNVNVPTPEVLPLVGIGALAVLAARRRRK